MGNRSSRENGRRTHAPAVRNRRFISASAPVCKSKTKKTMFVYPTCDWDEKHIVRMEFQKLIGPREEPLPLDKEIAGTHECGICFNAFANVLNQLPCCNYEICTECYLQLKAPPENLAKPDFVQPEIPSLCPYCRTGEFEVIYPPGKIISAFAATKCTKVHEAKASKAQPKAASVPRAEPRSVSSADFLHHVDVPESLEAVEQMMLMTALANSLREQEHTAAAAEQEHAAAAAASTTASAHASAATSTPDTARDRSTIPMTTSTNQFLTSDLAPRSPPMLPIANRRSRATTPELNVDAPKRTNSNGHAVMSPLII